MIFAFFARLWANQRVRAALLYLGAAIALALCVGLWFHFHDRRVIEQHEAGITKQVTAATNAANDTATANDAKRQADNARADESNREAISHAQTEHPDEVRRDAGPATRNVLGELRKRSAASRPSSGR